MNKKQSSRAFTLGELVVWMTIIWLLGIWITSFNFNRLSSNQEVDIEMIKINWILDEVKNNSLIWKWIWIDLQTPSDWEIFIENSSSSWSINAIYTISTWTGLLTSWEAKDTFEISNIRCQRLSPDNSFDSPTNNASLIFTWSDILLSWCSDNTYKKLNFTFWRWPQTRNISINSVTWVIESN